jgi:glucosamine-6-phosphate deaminase
MPLTVIVTRDYEQMSAEAAGLVITRVAALERSRSRCVLGLATGGSPVGLYRHLASAANQGTLNSGCWETFNLDEYVGLPGDTPEERAACPESYHAFMERRFFSLLRRRPARTAVPPGHRVDVLVLRRHLEDYPGDWIEEGTVSGRAVMIRPQPESPYLGWIRQEIQHAWTDAIRMAGGIDIQVLGVGGRGHVAFHEAGIPFHLRGLLLVKLDAVTRRHAVDDGYFATFEQTPEFALTMSLDLVFQARCVVVLANGARKREAIARSLLAEPSPETPMSYVQIYAARGGDVTFVLDEIAAADILAASEGVQRRGFTLLDRR